MNNLSRQSEMNGYRKAIVAIGIMVAVLSWHFISIVV
jgi:hypothetical protein